MKSEFNTINPPPVFSPPDAIEPPVHNCPVCGLSEAQRQYSWREYFCDIDRTPNQVWIVKDAMQCLSCGAKFTANIRSATFDTVDDVLWFANESQLIGWNDGVVAISSSRDGSED